MIDFLCMPSHIGSVIRIIILIVIGIPFVRFASIFFASLGKKQFSAHVGVVTSHIVFYSGLLFLVITILQECGFNVAALLGAAGVFGVAIGFASQTSISNIISGFFLLLERPFSVGDIIKSGEMIGIVESIDLLSVRIRTTDNKLIRLPNEIVLKHHLTNLTYYPVKRIDIILSVPYVENSDHCISIAQKAIANDPLFLTHPLPIIMIHKAAQHECTGEMRLFFALRVWIETKHFSSAPALLMQKAKTEFDKNNIAITISHIN